MSYLTLLLLAVQWLAPAPQQFAGSWTLDPSGTSAVDPWRAINLNIEVRGNDVSLVRSMSWGRREVSDTLQVAVTGQPVTVPFKQWLDNRHMGVWAGGDGTRQVTAKWLDEGRTLQLESTMTVETSQGERPMRVLSEYRLSPSGNRLTIIELRSARTRPVIYSFVRPS